MRRVLALLAAELLEFNAIRAAGFLLRAIIAGVANGAFEPDVFAHDKTMKPRGERSEPLG